MMSGGLTLKVNSEIAELLHGEENELISDLERGIGKQIEIYANPNFHLEEFDIFESPND
jgi:ribonuclease G